MLLRVIISEMDIRKVTLDNVPDTVHGLKEDKATLEVLISPPDTVSDSSLLPLSQSPSTSTLASSVVLPVSQSPSISTLVSSSFSQLKQSRLHPWPTVFTIPTFSYNVELRLKHGNEAYIKDGTLLKISCDMQTEILDKLAEAMFAYKAKPNKEEIKSVAIALLEKQPCQKEGDPQLGGKDQKTLEHKRELMCQEMKNRNPNKSFTNGAMSSTYALRRQEIIQKEPPVSEMKKKWPALFYE
ncbi:hypothetical protein E1301_Tti019192 [Triplophysa tibetana]|uniref:Uncharacterized protein n=1 Tax=Triplophysa tibetana TaxID=1572043 RepID=A0A5A9P3U6_9TELE|nr:hypothetical protein E1301_Tti019192 [Triplophysa tibetana]